MIVEYNDSIFLSLSELILFPSLLFISDQRTGLLNSRFKLNKSFNKLSLNFLIIAFFVSSISLSNEELILEGLFNFSSIFFFNSLVLLSLIISLAFVALDFSTYLINAS